MGLPPCLIEQGVAMLALNFSTIVRRELKDHLTQIRAENLVALAADDPHCATQDYCDANELMVCAFIQTFGEEPTSPADEELYIEEEIPKAKQPLELIRLHGELQAEADLINAAWLMAKRSGFRLGE